MTELTPLALKLRGAHNDAGGSHVKAWNNVAKVVEAELASVAESATVRPIRLPTVEEVVAVLNWPGSSFSDMAREVIDLVASRVPVWVPVEPGTVIKAGTRYRVETSDGERTEEGTYALDLTADEARWFIDPRTVPAEPKDPRVELLAEELEAASGCCLYSWPCSEANRWYRDARLILARLDAVRADA